MFDDSQFDGDRQEWLREFLEPFKVEEIQPFTDWYLPSGYYVSPEELRQALEVHTPSGFGNDIERSYADEQWQVPLLSSTSIIPFTDDELEQLLQEG